MGYTQALCKRPDIINIVNNIIIRCTHPNAPETLTLSKEELAALIYTSLAGLESVEMMASMQLDKPKEKQPFSSN